MDVGRAAVGVGDLLRRPHVVDVPVGQQHRRRRQAVLVEDPPQLAHRPLARVDDDGVGSGPLGQHVAVARQHAGRESGDQHGAQFPIPTFTGSRRPRSATAGTLVADRQRSWEDTAVPTNEQRRATAKRKLERQLERRASRTRKRRLYTIIGSAAAAVVVIGAVVATVVVTNRDSGSHDRVGEPRPRRRSAATPPDRRRRRRRHAAAVQGARRPGRQLPVPGVAAAGQQAEQAAPHRQGADRPAQVSASMVDQPGQHRPAARQRQVAVHGQQLRQPGPAGYFNDTPCHRLTTGPGLAVLQCGDPTGQAPAVRATSSPTSTRPTSTSPTTRS